MTYLLPVLSLFSILYSKVKLNYPRRSMGLSLKGSGEQTELSLRCANHYCDACIINPK